jgi:UDP-N-acetylglucosamine--N-acetylmuramyl-(pentapeptide) pyrophosphoryl-undecaprenol N-acetylglucosamine transferase
MKIIFTGGGTGGHIFPIIALAREIKKLRPDFNFYYIGPKDDFSSFLLQKEGIKVKSILAGKIRRYWTSEAILKNFLDIFKIPIGFLQSLFYTFFLFPDFVFSKGGYGSLAASISGWIFLTPVMLHESDITAGLSNRIISRISVEVFTSFSVKETKGFSPEKIISVGNPVRKEILEGSKEEAERIFGLKKEKPVLFISGGSQGSRRINNMILDILDELLDSFQVILQAGEANFKEVENGASIMVSGPKKSDFHPFSFLSDNQMSQALAVSQIIIARAGSGSIFEIAAAGKPSILIPLKEAAQNHQVENAYAYQKTGACQVIEEKNLTPHFFLEKIRYLISQPEELEAMREAAKDFSRPRAAEIIAKYLTEYLVY